MISIKKLIKFVASYPIRVFNGVSFRATVVESEIDKTTRIEHHANIRYSKIGRYTYISARSSVIHAVIGKFCSIASGVAIGGGAHDVNAVSTSPIFNEGRNIFNRNFGFNKFMPYKKTIIGNDVWIGNRAIIVQGVTIGDGAVIGAGAVVTKDVEPYSIVAGNPAHLIRMRFDHDTVQALLELKWWDYKDEWLRKYGDNFKQPTDLLKRIEVEKR